MDLSSQTTWSEKGILQNTRWKPRRLRCRYHFAMGKSQSIECYTKGLVSKRGRNRRSLVVTCRASATGSAAQFSFLEKYMTPSNGFTV